MMLEDVALGRDEKLAWADFHLEAARDMADFISMLADNGNSVPPHCFHTFTASMLEAAWNYRAAGLALLAGRVAYFARRTDVRAALEKFDRLNAGGCGIA
jgi:hypothetical protein